MEQIFWCMAIAQEGGYKYRRRKFLQPNEITLTGLLINREPS